MAPLQALYGTKCRTPLCWSELDEALTLGPELIQETIEMVKKIQEHAKVAQSKQKAIQTKKKIIRVSSGR